ncbi:Asp-tRNA(Asn)/Glu-tRNA(Gln) amidotransferase subunit GatA [Pseudoleptotrichia goodfellowii]|uniref:Glutamyl-tRNA(Gln) amidotransferase subunit A n=1 Tax=Pseudoleptotrichia goodfellowii TaxID=157692 RepID=A0A510J7Q6_9FUSO|nr:Asp-tRNA(Asn)/Glu-tRNA(Gln) amidotransferase subunit GatA [Pseudoleptotrichia goodfellowii]BBM35279.1 aspartyl/glutamyl-tRNA amidotransferase subunit A [Pseudoleptotrichia goodfellowii]
MELYKKTASEIAEMIKSKEITSEEVTKHFLERINLLEDKIGAFSSVLEEKALESAKIYDNDNNEEKRKNYDNTSLFGVPVALKDNILSKGDLTTASSKILANYEGIYDATVVERLKKAGVPIVGKANMDEFAMGSSNENSAIKSVSNPWDLERVPGGSSGGSAAAVAAQMIPIALGTDTGGSIRQPACLTGTVGIKPTYGRVSRYGLMAFGSSLDQIGALAKSTEDLARIMKIIAGYDEKDPTTADVEVPDYLKSINNDIKGLRIGLPKEYFAEGLDKNIKEVVNKAVEQLKGLGAEIKEVSLPYVEYAISTYYIISSAEAASNLSRYDGVRYGVRKSDDSVEDMYVKSRSEGFGPEVKRRIMIGNYVLSSGFYDAYYKKASQVRRLIKDDFERVLTEVDIILTPTSPTTAFKKGEKNTDPVQMYLADIYTVSINMAGVPAICVPAGFVDGLPVGIQLIGNYFKEDLLFNASHKFEEVRGKIEYPEI